MSYHCQKFAKGWGGKGGEIKGSEGAEVLGGRGLGRYIYVAYLCQKFAKGMGVRGRRRKWAGGGVGTGAG